MAFTVGLVEAAEMRQAIDTLRQDFTGTMGADASHFRVLDSMFAVVEEEDEGDRYYVGRDIEGIVAALVISGGMSKKIDELVAKRGYGGRMVAFAVTACKGFVSLDSFDADSTRFWAKMGFERFADLPAQDQQGGCKMRLKCATSPRWRQDDEQWIYVPLPRPTATARYKSDFQKFAVTSPCTIL